MCGPTETLAAAVLCSMKHQWLQYKRWLGAGVESRMGRVVEQLLRINVKRFRGGLVFKAHRLCVSLNSRLESKTEEKKNEESLEENQSCRLTYVDLTLL